VLGFACVVIGGGGALWGGLLTDSNTFALVCYVCAGAAAIVGVALSIRPPEPPIAEPDTSQQRRDDAAAQPMGQPARQPTDQPTAQPADQEPAESVDELDAESQWATGPAGDTPPEEGPLAPQAQVLAAAQSSADRAGAVRGAARRDAGTRLDDVSPSDEVTSDLVRSRPVLGRLAVAGVFLGAGLLAAGAATQGSSEPGGPGPTQVCLGVCAPVPTGPATPVPSP
jgi:hypothetical protein